MTTLPGRRLNDGSPVQYAGDPVESPETEDGTYLLYTREGRGPVVHFVLRRVRKDQGPDWRQTMACRIIAKCETREMAEAFFREAVLTQAQGVPLPDFGFGALTTPTRPAPEAGR